MQANNFFVLKKFPQAMDFMLKAEQAELKNPFLPEVTKLEWRIKKAECHYRLG